MTATSPATIRDAAPAEARWRTTWSERENDRRRRAYDAETAAWLRRHDQLVRLQIEAASFLGCTQPRTGLPVDLADDEVVYRVLPTAELVEAEARHVAGLPTPGLAGAATGPDGADRALPRGVRSVDAGMAVVTNHRVAFAGRAHRREWTYPDLVGPAHHPDAPLTLLHRTDGGRLAGLLVPATAAVNFRFYLTLAFATAGGRRATLAAEVDDLLDAHRRARPVPPPVAEPAHAPLTARRPDRRVAAATVLATLAFGTLTAGGFDAEQPGPTYRAQVGGSAAADAASTPLELVAPPIPGEPADGGAAAPVTGEPAPRATGGAGRHRSTRPTAPASRRPSVPPAIAAPAPAPPTVAPPPTSAPAPTTAPPVAPTTRPSTPPTTAPASSDPGSLLTLCLDPLQLPLLDPLLCPSPRS
ncbi:hypothetical protein Q3W71_04710 [Micromonospora sp. C28SCA-DRY-2]|uniref:hypothetical protein n=1 Tax=Micromonospora sp. C28SCA-DRY-2 TaxID=3059522 RepID=UPI002676F521|nr:hypothetical protein [Micromonospora sp. C28SCA-DRY-2]MDO3700979.1 hypothetical protein [Micromonospora sp. C28SCA-DRY-2]